MSRLGGGTEELVGGEDPQFLWFLPQKLVHGNEWAAWECEYVVKGSPSAGEIDVMRTDTREPWIQLGIFEVRGSALSLCMASGSGFRPLEFESTLEDRNILYVAKRSSEPLPE